jgi:carbamoyl-phosphate synthase large subunit
MDHICDHVYLFPYPSIGSSELLARLKSIHEKTRIDVIIPTLDSELQAFVSIEDKLKQMGIRSFLPDEESLKLRSKARFSQLQERFGIRVPRESQLPTRCRSTILRMNSLSIMVKGQFYDARIAYTPLEAERIFHSLRSEWGLPVIVQEYLTGEEYDIVALGDGLGGLVGAVPMKKLRLTDKGKAWGGITIEDPKMNEFAREVIERLKWRGPCELEIIKSRDDSQYYLIEINPRFPAWCYLSAGAGQNLPWACVKLALGESIDAFNSYETGIMFLRHSIDMVYPLSMYEAMTTEGELHRFQEITDQE